MASSPLAKKLMRDMRRSAMQFVALILLCMLGVFLFAGIDSFALITRKTNDAFFAGNNLAHFFITLPEADRSALQRLRAIDGVTRVQARFSIDMDADLPGDPRLNVTAFDGPMDINTPWILAGQALDPADRRGCLLQEAFADARGLSVGDSVTVTFQGAPYTLAIRGIVNSPEYISLSDGMAIDSTQYGYMLVNARAFEIAPLTQITVLVQSDADEAHVRAAIEEALPGAFIVDRRIHKSTSVVENNAQMFRDLSVLFPLAAYAVAALIVMTTLSRMVDHERQQIGTLRALGYSNARIRTHYLCYAIVPSLIGSLLGLFAGFYGLPAAFWDILFGQNEYPFLIHPPISAQSWAIAALNVFVSAGICLYTFHKSTRECTAALLRPKPPKDGAHIFLERIAPLWKRMSFNSKMISRNLLRSKLRTVMSLAGLLCCNALLIASMGLQDSVQATINGHYGGALSYDVCASLTAAAGDADAYERHLEAGRIECAMETSVSLRAGDVQRTTQLTVLRDDQTLIHLGAGGSFVPLSSAGAILTEKLSAVLGVSVGDTIVCRLPTSDDTFSLPVVQIAVNNLSQGMYLTRSAWDSLRKGSFTPTSIYLLDPAPRTLEKLDSMDEVEDIDLVTDLREEAFIYLNSVSMVFSILTVIALALAFVICYNMGLINFAERTREYATLKVLGYHQKEIRSLILSENLLITVIAIAVSILPGIGFTGMILSLVESESMRYMSIVTPRSMILASVITFTFSAFIQLLLARKVKGIVMVEALKSVE
ncbi:MAG: ABC transporter permease [Clostridia bacterium]|nr:ABC transporter permease [Clostridia bacterium]